MNKMYFLPVVALVSLLLNGCAGIHFGSDRKAEDAKTMKAVPVSFNAVPGWQQDNPAQALVAFRKSCSALQKRDPNAGVNPVEMGGKVRDWLPACRAAENQSIDAKVFFETWFQPYKIQTELGETGLFTGYYEAMLHGSRTKSSRYHVPLYKRPSDLVMVELGDFRPSMKNERIAGKIVDGRLKPYADRAAIDNGALAGKNLEIVYVDDADSAFFLHIQGSGRVVMDNGQHIRVGYDAQNGHVYHAIGRDLIARGELTPETTSLQTIRAWLKNHPAEAAKLRQRNPSYIFFRELKGEGPLGAQGVALTPARSLAVDPRFVPYGAPVYISAQNPLDNKKQIQRLMVAQDTGGAIRGPVRGDMFWGTGVQAEDIAGKMKSRGTAWVLLPKAIPVQQKNIQLAR